MRTRRAALVAASALCSLALLVSPVAGESWDFELDPESTRIRFTLGATLHSVEGRVAPRGGRLTIDPDAGTLSGRIVADATSADTGNKRRDRDMHAKVLESESHPDFVLEAKAFTGELARSGASEISVEGELAIHGGVHAVTFPVSVHIEGDRLTASAALSIPYVEWGMRNPSKALLRVEKQVEVSVDLVGTIRKAPSLPIDPPGR